MVVHSKSYWYQSFRMESFDCMFACIGDPGPIDHILAKHYRFLNAHPFRLSLFFCDEEKKKKFEYREAISWLKRPIIVLPGCVASSAGDKSQN